MAAAQRDGLEDRVVSYLQGRSPPLYVSPIKSFKSPLATTLRVQKPWPGVLRLGGIGSQRADGPARPLLWGVGTCILVMGRGGGGAPLRAPSPERRWTGCTWSHLCLQWQVGPQTAGPAVPGGPVFEASRMPGFCSLLPLGFFLHPFGFDRSCLASSKHKLGPGTCPL